MKNLINDLKKLKIIIDDLNNDIETIIDDFYSILEKAELNYLYLKEDKYDIYDDFGDGEDIQLYDCTNLLDYSENAKNVIDELIILIKTNPEAINLLDVNDINILVSENL